MKNGETLYYNTYKPNVFPQTLTNSRFIRARWCESCNHEHGPSYICLSYAPEIIEKMLEEGCLRQDDYDEWAMWRLDGNGDDEEEAWGYVEESY